jgi:Ca-activated chloride channel family protein
MSPAPLAAAMISCLVSREGHKVPLLGVALSGRVFGAHARLVLRQRYRNDEARPIEAVYTFPVPSDAALVGFAMEAAGRRVEAEIKEREEAFRIYDDAVYAGHGAALLDEERRNVFTASVGNLLPGEETMIEVVYVQPLSSDEGALRLMIPTLVAPRYIPGAPAGDRTAHGVVAPTDRVPDADRITPAIGAVSYGLSLDLVFDLGRELTIESPSHQVVVSDAGDRAYRVAFRASEVPLDRDLVLLANGAAGVSAGVVAEKRAGKEGTFALTVVPDLFDPQRRVHPRDVIFVVDVSGSMEGDSLREAKSALRLCLRHLAEGDRFQILAFSDTFFAHEPAPVPFTQKTLATADAWVDALQTIGGTEMLEPLLAAARALEDSGARDRIIVLLTDGQVGNEAEIAARVCERAGKTRIYTFGIGTNVSDLLLGDLARRTRGAVEFIHPGERIDEKVTAQFARATAARVQDLTLRFSGIDAGELSPSQPGDLVDGEPWVVFGRYAEPAHGKAELRGTLRGEPFYLEVPIELPAEAEREGLSALWATARIRELEEGEAHLAGRRAEANRQRIVALSIEHRVASKFASFVLVEKRTGDRRAHGLPETRPIPVHAPAGWAIGVPAEPAEMMKPASFVYAPAPAAMDGFAEMDFLAAPAPARAYAMPATGAPPPMMAREKSVTFSLADLAEQMEEGAPEPSGGEDAVAALFTEQLASGLWGREDDSDAARLLATARAFAVFAEHGVDTAHPVYGAQVKKAIEAVLALAKALAGDESVRAALEAAAKVAAGRRLQAEIKGALAAG